MKIKDLKKGDKFKLSTQAHTTFRFDSAAWYDSALKADTYFCYDMLDGHRYRFTGDLDVILPPFKFGNL